MIETTVSYRPGDVYRVVLGEHNMNQEEGTEQIREVLRIVVHPKWDINFVAQGWVDLKDYLKNNFSIANQ